MTPPKGDDRINKGYKDGFNGHKNAYNSSGLSQYEVNVDAAKQSDDIKDAENNTLWKTNLEKNNSEKKRFKISLNSAKSLLKFNKKKGVAASIITFLLIALVAGGSFLSLALGPIAFVENVVDDLNDQLASIDIAGKSILRSKIPNQERKEALRGCTKLSIRCKFKTITNKQIKRLSSQGIEVIPDTSYRNIVGFDRTVPAEYKFQGQSYSADAWAEQLKVNKAAQRAQLKANNMKYLGVSDSTFGKYVLKRFNITKKPPELKGSHQDRVNALMNKTDSKSASGIKFEPIDPEGNPVAEGSKEHTGYKLEGDPSNKHYSKAEYEKMQTSIDRITNAKPLSKVTKASIGALSAFGVADLACSIKNMVGGATVAAKVMNQTEAIQYSMGIISKVHEMKSGDISAEDASAIGEFFTGTDTRSKIPDATSGVTSQQGTVKDLEMKDNPNYGKNALDSELYKMSTNGGVAKPNPNFSMGMGQNTLLSNFSNAATAVNSVSSGTCSVVQNWGVRLVGIVAAVAAGVGSSGASLLWQAATAGALMGAMVSLEWMLNSWLQGSIIESSDLTEDTVARGDVTWTGIGGIMGASAQARGLMPGTAEQITDYVALSQDINNEYIAIERESSSPLDIYDQYSFLGSVARLALSNLPTESSIASFIGGLPSFIGGGLMSPLSSEVKAKTYNPDRFKSCDDTSYKNLGIDPDVQCNIRYVMSKEDLSLDPDSTALWMEEKGYVEKDTTTGYPKNYTPPEPAASQGAVVDFVKGTAEGFVDQFLNRRAETIGEGYNDYAKFLDYCVYRTMPFGETFEDNQPIKGVGSGWTTGKKCMEDSPMLSHFRMYTLFITTNDAIDGEGEL